MHGYSKDKEALLARLARIEGQIRGISRMVEADTYCIDVLTQITAAGGALKKVGTALLEDHIGHCVADAVADKKGNEKEMVREAGRAIDRLVRS